MIREIMGGDFFAVRCSSVCDSQHCNKVMVTSENHLCTCRTGSAKGFMTYCLQDSSQSTVAAKLTANTVAWQTHVVLLSCILNKP